METFLKKKAEIDNMRDFKSYEVAEWYYNADDLDSALSYINKYLSVDPDNAAAQELMIKIIERRISTDRVPSSRLRNFALHNEVDGSSVELEENPTYLDEDSRYVLWQSCLSDVIQARSSLNSSLHRLTTPALQGHHSDLITRLSDIITRLLDTEITMFNQDTLSEDNSFELFSEEPPIIREAQDRREESTALQQMVARQSELLENLQLQATANQNLLKGALDEIRSLREEVRLFKRSTAVKTEP